MWLTRRTWVSCVVYNRSWMIKMIWSLNGLQPFQHWGRNCGNCWNGQAQRWLVCSQICCTNQMNDFVELSCGLLLLVWHCWLKRSESINSNEVYARTVSEMTFFLVGNCQRKHFDFVSCEVFDQLRLQHFDAHHVGHGFSDVWQWVELAHSEYHVSWVHEIFQRFSSAINRVDAAQNVIVAWDSTDELMSNVHFLENRFVLDEYLIQICRWSNQLIAHSSQVKDFVEIQVNQLGDQAGNDQSGILQVVNRANFGKEKSFKESFDVKSRILPRIAKVFVHFRTTFCFGKFLMFMMNQNTASQTRAWMSMSSS